MSVTILSQAKKQSVTNCPLSILSGVSKKFASSHLAPFILASAERYTCLCCISHRDDRWEISYKKSDYKWNRFITDVVVTLSCWVASKALILSSLLSEKQSIQLAVDIQFENEVTNAMEKTLSQTAKVKKMQQDWSNRISWLNCAHIFELRIVWSDLIIIKHCIPKELDFQIHVVVW